MKNKSYSLFLVTALLAASASVMQAQAQDEDQKIAPDIVIIGKHEYARIDVPASNDSLIPIEVTTEPVVVNSLRKLSIEVYVGGAGLGCHEQNPHNDSILKSFGGYWIPRGNGTVTLKFLTPRGCDSSGNVIWWIVYVPVIVQLNTEGSESPQ